MSIILKDKITFPFPLSWESVSATPIRFAHLAVKNKIMVEELLEMTLGETADKSHFNYDSFITTKSRLKRNGKGEWQSSYSKGVLMVKRTK